MSGVEQRTVERDDAEMRLDRWFKRHFPELSHGRLEKLLRTGQVRVDGKRAKAAQRLLPGQVIRVPPFGAPPPEAAAPRPEPDRPAVSPAEAAAIQGLVLYRDSAVLAVNKPPGLAVQGGAKVDRHLDALLDALRFDAAERPRLVHRLDRDTSGVLLLARTAPAARALALSFRGREAHKLYWAAVAGVPKPREGRIDLPLAKTPGGRGEIVAPDEEEGRRAVTLYRVVDSAGSRAAWLALAPLTGRTHQLRVHAAALGTPILGDGKYGGAEAFLPGAEIARQLHLHARRIVLPHPVGRGTIDVTAPLPEHMAATWRYLGFDPAETGADRVFGEG